MLLIVILTLATVVAASLHIRAEYRGPQHHVYTFKPLTTISIILLALHVGTPDPTFYTYAIIAGLVCSFAGDIFLMLPSDQFIPGLVSFLVAHLLYIAAFTSGTGFGFSWWALAPRVVFGIIMFRMLSPHLGKMKFPVVLYMAVILVMAWQAWERWGFTGQPLALIASLGAVLFVVSDAILALNRFRAQFKTARLLNLTTYFAAQWLIALSALSR